MTRLCAPTLVAAILCSAGVARGAGQNARAVPPQMTASKPPSAPGDAQRVIGITLVAVAGVGAMIGTVSAVGAANAVAEYNRGCDEDRCHSELDREIETKRTTAVIAFTLSACAALVGVSLWLTAPSSQKTPQARVTWTPRGPGDRPGVTLRARF